MPRTRQPSPRPQRGAVRRLLETRGVVGGHHAPRAETRLLAADGVRLAATYLPGPPGAPATVLAHGLLAHRRKPSYALLADELSRSVSVLSIDLRGHGGSGGASTLGDREALDVAAGVAWLRAYGHPWVAAVGLSMGGTAVLHAAADGAALDAAVIVSVPARFGRRDVPAMALLHEVWTTPWKRRGVRAITRVRMCAPEDWRPFLHPVDAAADVGIPLLVVHGEDDHFFPVRDAVALAAAAGSSATLWREPNGFGHAEDGISPGFAAALARALGAARLTGRFPVRPAAPLQPG